MELFASPFTEIELASPRLAENREFFEHALARARGHRFYSHPFLSAVETACVSPRFVTHVLTSFFQVVSPFTGLLCTLAGRAPTIQARHVLMDNLFEEMGRGDLSAAHPVLYLKMLASIGVSADAAEQMARVPAIQYINEHLRETVERHPFPVACAVLASAEAVIPASFPVLAAIARQTFADIDMGFFHRHGGRDDGHASDAALLVAATADGSHFAAMTSAIQRDLDCRAELLDFWIGLGREC